MPSRAGPVVRRQSTTGMARVTTVPQEAITPVRACRRTRPAPLPTARGTSRGRVCRLRVTRRARSPVGQTARRRWSPEPVAAGTRRKPQGFDVHHAAGAAGRWRATGGRSADRRWVSLALRGEGRLAAGAQVAQSTSQSKRPAPLAHSANLMPPPPGQAPESRAQQRGFVRPLLRAAGIGLEPLDGALAALARRSPP